jgi:hypothetical protein
VGLIAARQKEGRRTPAKWFGLHAVVALSKKTRLCSQNQEKRLQIQFVKLAHTISDRHAIPERSSSSCHYKRPHVPMLLGGTSKIAGSFDAYQD